MFVLVEDAAEALASSYVEAGYLVRICDWFGAMGAASSRFMTMFFAACVTQDAAGCAVAPRTPDTPTGVLDHREHVQPRPDSVTVSRKSHASRASAWERRKSAHVLEARSGAGLIPASWRISQTVEAATLISRTSSSPWMRRYPQPGFSRASRTTRSRIERGARPS